MKHLLRIAFLSIVACGATASMKAAEYSFIAHSDTTQSAFRTEDAKNILLGFKTKWANGAAIKLAVVPTSPIHETVIQGIAGKTKDQFEKNWKKLVFTGAGTMPEQLPDEAACIAYVSKTPGAFAYVSTAQATTATVKVINVQ